MWMCLGKTGAVTIDLVLILCSLIWHVLTITLDPGLVPISICEDNDKSIDQYFDCKVKDCQRSIYFKLCPENEVSNGLLNFYTLSLNCINPTGAASSTSNDTSLVPVEKCTANFSQDNFLRCEYQSCWFVFDHCSENESWTKNKLLNFHTHSLVCQNIQPAVDQYTENSQKNVLKITTPTQKSLNSGLTITVSCFSLFLCIILIILF